MEINLDDIDSAEVQAEMLASAMLPEGKTLPDILGAARYARAAALAHEARRRTVRPSINSRPGSWPRRFRSCN